MKYLKVTFLSITFALLLTLGWTMTGNARTLRPADTVSIGKDEVIEHMVIVSGSTVNIAGTIDGDVYCAGQNITISGKVTGDVLCVGQTVTVEGSVDGNVRLAGQTVIINGAVSKSASVAAQSLTVGKDSVITRDLASASQRSTIVGTIQRDTAIAGSNVLISGKIGRNVSGEIENLTIGSGGAINGNVDYASKNDPVIDKGGVITGKVTRTPLPERAKWPANIPFAFTVLWFVYIYLAMLALSLVVAGLMPRVLNTAADTTMKHLGRTVLVGLIAAIVVPLLIFALLVSAIGAPIALVLLLGWMLILLLSGPFAAYLLGRLMIRKPQRALLVMLAGASVLLVTYFIPLVGFIMVIAASLFGIGMILTEIQHSRINPSKNVL